MGKTSQESPVLLPVLFASLALVQQTPPQTPPVTPQPVAVQTPAPTQTAAVPAADAAASPPSEMAQVCRMEPVTGSRFGRRVCRSAIETADERREGQEMLRRMQGSRMPDGG